MLQNVTSYDNATVGQGSLVNDLLLKYNTFSQLITEYQSHSGAATTSSPSVQHGYANGAANTIRPSSFSYPSGRVLNYNYGSSGGMDDLLSRIAALIDNDGTTHLADYTRVGLDRIVEVSSPTPGTKLTYIKQGSEGTGDGGDQYTGWDRFSRVVDQRWIKTSAGTPALERIQYGFDQASNRQYRANLVGSSQDEYYTYDGLYQLATLTRGTLNAGKTAISGTPVWEEDFTLDPTGNWNNYVTKVTGGTTLNQSRTHNKANEIITIAGSSTVITHDAAGNVTQAPKPSNWTAAYALTYDAWNRLVKVTDGFTTVATYGYDGRNRRVTKTSGATIRHYYYTETWQIVEERVGASTSADRQFIWGLRYLDDLVLRDRGSERFYAFHDYFNFSAIVDTSGTIQERYGYDAFGNSRVMDASFGDRAVSNYDWETRFADSRWDGETGFCQIRNRSYHLQLGRWLRRDPVEYDDSANLYLYVFDNPINFIDVLGLNCSVTLACNLASSSNLGKCGVNCCYSCTEISRDPSLGGTLTCDDVPKPASSSPCVADYNALCVLTMGKLGGRPTCAPTSMDYILFMSNDLPGRDCSKMCCIANCKKAHDLIVMGCGKLKGTAKTACELAADAGQAVCVDGCNAWCKKP